MKLEFHGSKVTSDTGLLAYRELDDALGLTEMADETLTDTRTGRMAATAWSGNSASPSLVALGDTTISAQRQRQEHEQKGMGVEEHRSSGEGQPKANTAKHRRAP